MLRIEALSIIFFSVSLCETKSARDALGNHKSCNKQPIEVHFRCVRGTLVLRKVKSDFFVLRVK